MTRTAETIRQNIADRARASADSDQVELGLDLSLNGAARKSLDELLLNFETFLRQRKLRQWSPNDPEAEAVRGVGLRDGAATRDYEIWFGCTAPGVVANAIICLIRQLSDLLTENVSSSERGETEQALARPIEEQRWGAPTGPLPGAPSCPKCGEPMALRTARKGARAGGQFWGCSGYPKCTGTRAGA